MPPKYHKPSQAVTFVLQLSHALSKNRQVGVNLAVHICKQAVAEMELNPPVTPATVTKLLQFHDQHPLRQLKNR